MLKQGKKSRKAHEGEKKKKTNVNEYASGKQPMMKSNNEL